MALPPWQQIEQRMRQANESPESIQSALQDYESRNANIVMAPRDSDKPVMSLQSQTISRTPSQNYESFNPPLEEAKKMVESVSQARALYDQLDVVKKAADRLIPPADVLNLGPVETGIMGSVKGLQRSIGNNSFIRTEEHGLRPWEQYSSGVMSILARGLGEKGVLSDQDLKRTQMLLPKPDDTNVSREENFKLLKEFVKSRIDSFDQRLKESQYAGQ